MVTGTGTIGTPQTFARIVNVTFCRRSVPILAVYYKTHTDGLYKVLCSFRTSIILRGPAAMVAVRSPIQHRCMEHGRLIEAAATTTSSSLRWPAAGSHCVFTQLI